MEATATAAPMIPEPIAAAINAVMQKANGVEKRGHNNFHNYDFAKVEDLLAKLQPEMAAAGLFIIQSEHDIAMLADGRLMKIQYAFRLGHKSGAVWSDPILHSGAAGVFTPNGKLDDKCVNKCHTAARKYFLLGLTQIPVGNMPDTDADNAPGEDSAPKNGKQTSAKETPAQNGARAPAAQRTKAKGHATAPAGDPTAKTLIEGIPSHEGLYDINERAKALGLHITRGKELPPGPPREAYTLEAIDAAYAKWDAWRSSMWPKLSEDDKTAIGEAIGNYEKVNKRLASAVAKQNKQRAADAAATGADPETGELPEYEEEGAA